MNALSTTTQSHAADRRPAPHSRRPWTLGMAAALIAAGSACGPLVQSAAAHSRHHSAHRRSPLRHHVVGARRNKTREVKRRLFKRTSRKVSHRVPVIALSGTVIRWGARYPSSKLRGAISTAPRRARRRHTTYVSLATGDSWKLRAEPGQTLYYGVEFAGRWSTRETKVSWSEASSGAAAKPVTSTNTPNAFKGAPSAKSGPTASKSPPTAKSGTTSGAASGAGPTTTGSSSPMLVGLNESGWGAAGASDVASTFKIDRMDVSFGEDASDFWTRGVAVDMLFSGPYSSGGVSSIDPVSWAHNAVSTFQSQCNGSATHCPAIEVLNEPYGNWFWGANAMSSGNEAAYAHLLVDTFSAFHNQYGSASPKILAAYTSGGWWSGIQAAVPNINSYVDGVTVHPYGGTSGAASSALGDQGLVIDAHRTTGQPIWVTEFGWPTAIGQAATDDSLQWTDPEQAINTYDFVNWLRGLGYVSAAMDFNYRDYGTNDFYGVETSAGVKKPAWTALAEAADQQPCTVCG